MEALLYLPTAQALMWGQSDNVRAAIAAHAEANQPARAYALRASVTMSADHTGLAIERLHGAPTLIFEAIEQPLPLVARPRDYWYPQLTSQVRPERYPRQPHPNSIVIYGPPRGALSALRDSIAVSDPRTGHYLGRAFWRVDREGFWGCWSDATESSGPCHTLAELTALLCAGKGIYAD